MRKSFRKRNTSFFQQMAKKFVTKKCKKMFCFLLSKNMRFQKKRFAQQRAQTEILNTKRK